MQNQFRFAMVFGLLAAWALLGLAQSEKETGQKSNDKVDVSGAWDFTVETSQGSGSPKFQFVQDGEKLSGTYKGTFGESKVTGTVKGNAIKFSFPISAQGTELDAVYSGTVEKDRMKGTVTFGEYATGTWTAVRAKSQDTKKEKKSGENN
jgi:hypothetical protein